MGKKIKKVSTADKDMDDADQIEFKEASEVPVSDKKDAPKIEKLVKEPPKKDEKPAEPEKKQEAPAPVVSKDDRVSVDAALSEPEEPEEPVKPAKKPTKLQLKKKAAKVESKPKEPPKVDVTNKLEEDIIVPGLIDDEIASPDLVGSMKAQESRPHEAWKILFSGLDFAGKSSIIATVKNEFEKIVNPQPTKLTERSEFTFLGQSIHDWDMGGQRLYRIQYPWSTTQTRASSST
jgi:hypothetical protein